MIIISIHALRGEGDCCQRGLHPLCLLISIHALRGEGDATPRSPTSSTNAFLSTPSVGRATKRAWQVLTQITLFLSTPSVGRATTTRIVADLKEQISIHALRGEGDYSHLYAKHQL